MAKIQPEWVTNPPISLAEKTKIVQINRNYFKSPGIKGRTIRRLWKEIQQEHADLTQRAKELQPLAFFKPSFEQALILNSWMYGISFNCIYTANRIGKTVASIVNVLLWLIPNDPTWLIFQPYEDHLGRPVRVFPRPNITKVRIIREHIREHRLTPNPSLPPSDPINAPTLQSLQNHPSRPLKSCYPEHPWPGGGTIWFGAPDHDHHEKILFPLWKQYIPANIIDRYSPSQKEITLKIATPTDPKYPNHPTRITQWDLVGKSYESKDTKWSSGAVDIITLTEGVTPDTMKEIKLRFKDPGIGSHDFTPYEPANSGAASHLAQCIYKGTEVLPLAHHVFKGFSVRNAPDHIISKDKKAGLIASFEGTPEAAARIDGEFYTSSALVLSNLSRQVHLLPYTHKQFKLINQTNLPKFQILRGFDPGLDHPTACVWAYLLPTNQLVIYRIMAERNLTIPERATRIITLSNNTQSKTYYEPKKFYAIETHTNPNSEVAIATITDYHTFKEDEVTGMPYSLNYILNGLNIVPSTHLGPEDRAIAFNSDLQPSQYLPSLMPPEHIITTFHKHNTNPSNHNSLPEALQSLQTPDQQMPNSQLPFRARLDTDVIQSGIPPAPRIYFLQYAKGVMATFLKWEDFYWERKRSGDDKGQPKDSIPSHEDDELDAASYISCSQYRWTNYQPSARVSGDSEPEDELIEGHTLQPLQRSQSNQTDQGFTIFGDESVVHHQLQNLNASRNS